MTNYQPVAITKNNVYISFVFLSCQDNLGSIFVSLTALSLSRSPFKNIGKSGPLGTLYLCRTP